MSTTCRLILEIYHQQKNNEPAKGIQIFHPLQLRFPYTIRGRAEVMAVFQEVLMGATSQEVHCPNVSKWIPSNFLASGPAVISVPFGDLSLFVWIRSS